MTKRIVSFSEDEVYYMALGDIGVSVPKSGNYDGINVRGDRRFCVSRWSLMQGVPRGVTVTWEAARPALYLNWNYKGKDHKICVGLIKDINEARAWVDEVNSRYRSAS